MRREQQRNTPTTNKSKRLTFEVFGKLGLEGVPRRTRRRTSGRHETQRSARLTAAHRIAAHHSLHHQRRLTMTNSNSNNNIMWNQLKKRQKTVFDECHANQPSINEPFGFELERFDANVANRWLLFGERRRSLLDHHARSLDAQAGRARWVHIAATTRGCVAFALAVAVDSRHRGSEGRIGVVVVDAQGAECELTGVACFFLASGQLTAQLTQPLA